MFYELKYNFIKHATAIIIFLFFSIISYGQFIMGAGYINTVATNAIYKGNQITFNAYDKVYNGFYAGIGYAIPLPYGLHLTPGFYIESFSGKFVIGELNEPFTTQISEKQVHLDFPLHLSYGIDLTARFRVLAFAGPVFTYGLRDVSKERTIFNYDDKETEVEYDFYMDDDMANRFDIKLGGGLGIELLDHFVLTAGFSWGLFVANDAVYDVEIL